MEPIQGLLWTLMVTVDDQDTCELLDNTIALIEMNRRRQTIVQEVRLSSTSAVANTLCNGICKYYAGTYLTVFLSQQIVMLQTAKFISL